MPVNSIVHIKPIDVVKGDLDKVVDDIKLMKLTIDELKRDIKKINIKLKAKESIENDNIVSGGWWYWS
tara:strand:- start:395 stop:598 length:204 start_codon:yes stop_codon:yes gene_type:complete